MHPLTAAVDGIRPYIWFKQPAPSVILPRLSVAAAPTLSFCFHYAPCMSVCPTWMTRHDQPFPSLPSLHELSHPRLPSCHWPCPPNQLVDTIFPLPGLSSPLTITEQICVQSLANRENAVGMLISLSLPCFFVKPHAPTILVMLLHVEAWMISLSTCKYLMPHTFVF